MTKKQITCDLPQSCEPLETFLDNDCNVVYQVWRDKHTYMHYLTTPLKTKQKVVNQDYSYQELLDDMEKLIKKAKQ